MKHTIAEFGILLISVLFAATIFICVVPMFQDGGAIKEGILDYINNIC